MTTTALSLTLHYSLHAAWQSVPGTALHVSRRSCCALLYRMRVDLVPSPEHMLVHFIAGGQQSAPATSMVPAPVPAQLPHQPPHDYIQGDQGHMPMHQQPGAPMWAPQPGMITLLLTTPAPADARCTCRCQIHLQYIC